MDDTSEDKIIFPHFMNYTAVENVDETASQALNLGGKIIVSPTDISNVGCFSIIQDQTGTTFSVLTLRRI